MRSLAFPIVFASAFAASAAIAQTESSSMSTTNTPGALATGKPIGLAPSNTMGIPHVVAPSDIQAGASNYTEAQARARIQSAGFTNISELKKDSSGVWRATAKHGERTAQVAFDYKGNLAAQ